MIQKLLTLCALALSLACGGEPGEDEDLEPAEFGQVQQGIQASGTLSYLNRWTGGAFGDGGTDVTLRFRNYSLSVKPVTNVKFCLRGPGVGGPETCTFTNATNGTFTLIVPVGQYTARVYWIPSDVDRTFKLVETDGDTLSFDDNSIQVQVASGQPINLTIGGSSWPDNNDSLRASVYAQARAQFDVLGNTFNLNNLTPEWSTMGTIKIRNATVASGGPGMMTVPHFQDPTPNVIWHEMGHSIEGTIHTVKYGTAGRWPAGGGYYSTDLAGCLTPNGQGQRASNRAMSEGWADFVAEIVRFNTFANAGTLNCASGTASCGVANISTQNPTTMPQCGPGSATRDRSFVKKALMDLVDNAQISPLGTCLQDNVQLSVGQVFNAMVLSPHQPTQPGQTYGNSTINFDEISLLDFLRQVRVNTGVNVYSAWANSCFQHGLASGTLN